MAKTEHYYTRFEEGRYYHIYNRTVDKQAMFRNDANYHFFLKRYDEYISPVAETFAYCLLGNHFHLLIRVKEDLHAIDLTTFKKLSNLGNDKPKSVHEIVSHQFRKFFQSYSMAYNKQHNRIGTLFQTPFKRALVDKDSYYTQLIYYIHTNPQLHRLIDDFRDWPYSSYKRMLIEKPSKLMKKEVLDWFGDTNRYKEYHQMQHEMISETHLLLDDIGDS